MASGYSARDAENMFMSAVADLNKMKDRLEALQRKLKVEEETLAANRPAIEEDKQYKYFKNAMERVEVKRKTESELWDSKINALAAKRDAYVEMINAQIAALEIKREAAENKITNEDRYYFSELNRIEEKLLAKEPINQSYRKTRTDAEILEKEIYEAERKCNQLRFFAEAAHDKQMERRKREAQEEERRQQQLAHIERMEALAAIERQREATRKEEEERNRKRVEEAKAALAAPKKTEATEAVDSQKKKPGRPKIQIEWPLVPGKEYTMEQLWSLEIDYDTITDEQDEIYERAVAAASKRENIPGWWDMKYNKEG